MAERVSLARLSNREAAVEYARLIPGLEAWGLTSASGRSLWSFVGVRL